MSLTRLYMHVVPVLDIRVMLQIYPPFLNRTDRESMNTK